MAIPTALATLCNNFFAANAQDFDMAHADECGEYMEALIPHCQAHGFDKVGFLRKNPGQTQYNGHAVDALAYDLGNNLTHAVDCIGNAEQPHPWKSEGGTNDDPRATFNEDMNTAYKTDKDWLERPGESNGGSNPNTVPWVTYNEQGFERLKRMLKHDYERRPQGPDYDVSVWSARFFHNHYMGPEGTPLSEDAALSRVKNELCIALGIPNDGYLGE